MWRAVRSMLLVVVATFTLGLGRPMQVAAAPATPPPTTVPVDSRPADSGPVDSGPAPTDNDLIPANQNLSNCVGTLERPDCGSPAKSDIRLYLTFAVLMLGMALIGWRIAVGVRQRDRGETTPDHTF